MLVPPPRTFLILPVFLILFELLQQSQSFCIDVAFLLSQVNKLCVV